MFKGDVYRSIVTCWFRTISDVFVTTCAASECAILRNISSYHFSCGTFRFNNLFGLYTLSWQSKVYVMIALDARIQHANQKDVWYRCDWKYAVHYLVLSKRYNYGVMCKGVTLYHSLKNQVDPVGESWQQRGTTSNSFDFKAIEITWFLVCYSGTHIRNITWLTLKKPQKKHYLLTVKWSLINHHWI